MQQRDSHARRQGQSQAFSSFFLSIVSSVIQISYLPFGRSLFHPSSPFLPLIAVISLPVQFPLVVDALRICRKLIAELPLDDLSRLNISFIPTYGRCLGSEQATMVDMGHRVSVADPHSTIHFGSSLVFTNDAQLYPHFGYQQIFPRRCLTPVNVPE